MPKRYVSREILIGNLTLGGDRAIRVQSMVNTPTLNTLATVDQVVRLAKAGCELVRITAANIREAENLKNILQELKNKNIDIPLIADIHFQPKAAEVAARIVDKVRINPGNYTNPHHRNKKYSETDYRAELEQISRNLKPLLNICKQHNTALRIGINHGSLPGHILYKYGNTPEGMVISAMEFISVCRNNNFHNLTLSLKASDVTTMIEANRLMVDKMKKEGIDYPLHLGVTEAGNGTEGRIKSAMGIGTLLAEGIGDTIRVSLTEPPENEIPVAKKLIEYYGRDHSKRMGKIQWQAFGKIPVNQRVTVVSIKENKPLSDNSKILLLSYPFLSFNNLLIRAAVDFNLAYEKQKPDGVFIRNGFDTDPGRLKELALQILQARGLRYYKTEFIACPSCGRTHFNIEKELKKVKKRLGNIKGLKIAVMGCLVNGPGEMAGADYGFVGSAPGKVDLYQGPKILFKNLTEEEALDRLEKIILGK